MNDLEEMQRRFYSLDEAAFKKIVDALIREELSVVGGGLLDRFEEASAKLLGGSHAVAACNGTAALHMALFAIDLQPGDEVLMPTYGYYAMSLPVCMMGAKPVFCDIREDSLAMDLDDAESMITPRTKAIIVHQPWGCPADVDGLRRLAAKYGLSLISDSSHAHGAGWRGLPLGHYYDILCASMGKGKLISGGELGVAVTSSGHLRDRMLLYGHVNRVPEAFMTPRYRHMHNAVGIKYRPHPVALALALHQMETYANRSERLTDRIRAFEDGLGTVEGFSPFTTPVPAKRVYWRVPVRVQNGDSTRLSELILRLRERGCPVDGHRAPALIHQHNVLTNHYGVIPGRSFPVAERMVDQTVLLQAFSFFDEHSTAHFLEQFRAVSPRGADSGRAL